MKIDIAHARAQIQAEKQTAEARLIALVYLLSGATIERAQVIGDRLVFSGAPAEVERLARHLSDMLKVADVHLEPPAADDPDWTFCRIPVGALDRAAVATRPL